MHFQVKPSTFFKTYIEVVFRDQIQIIQLIQLSPLFDPHKKQKRKTIRGFCGEKYK
jgi:hypothetical protein